MTTTGLGEQTSTGDREVAGYAVEVPTRTIADLAEETGFLRNQTHLLVQDSSQVHADSTRLHTKALELLLRTRTGERSREPLDELLTDLSEAGFAWRDLARLAGVSVPAVRKWRRGESATGENRRRVAEIVAFCDVVDERDLISDVAGWLEVPLVEGVPISGLDLLAAERFDLLFRWAGEFGVDPEGILDEFQPEWRTTYESEFEVFVDTDGYKALRSKTLE